VKRASEKNRRKFVLLSFLVTFSDWVATSLINVEIFRLTGSLAIMAWFRFFLFVPPFLFGSWAVELSRKILPNYQLGICLFGMGMVKIGVGVSYYFDIKGLWVLGFYYAAYGILLAFYRPVSDAFAARISPKGKEGATKLSKSIGGNYGFLLALGVVLFLSYYTLEKVWIGFILIGCLMIVASVVQISIKVESLNCPGMKNWFSFFKRLTRELNPRNRISSSSLGFLISVNLLSTVLGRASNLLFFAYLAINFQLAGETLDRAYLGVRALSVAVFTLLLWLILKSMIHKRESFMSINLIAATNILACVIMLLFPLIYSSYLLILLFPVWWFFANLGGEIVGLKVLELEISEQKSGDYFALLGMANILVPFLVLVVSYFADTLHNFSFATLGLVGLVLYLAIWRIYPVR